LMSPSEIASIRYNVASIDQTPPHGLVHEPVIDAKGNGTLPGRISEKGLYNFEASATVVRDIPTDIPEAVREAINRLHGDKISLKSNTVNFAVMVEGKKTIDPALTLSIEPPVEDKWILGVPYTKNIYVGGPAPELVTFNCSDKRFTINKDAGKIQLHWSQPISGLTRVVVTANANRDLGELDVAEAKFSIEVGPPVWQPEPHPIAYNRVTYKFESILRGLNPGDYTIQVLANKAELKATVSPNQFPYEVRPDPSWKTMTFRAMGHAAMLKEFEVPVKEPPPPQIRWRGENHEGNDHVIQFYCEDVDGGDVSVNFNIVQPQGVKAVMNPPRRGKSFTITIKDVGSIRESHIELSVTAIGIGGASKTPARTVVVK
jgi:hypothetical protein